MNRTQMVRAPRRPAVAIRAACPADMQALRGFFAGLSPQSRLLRFFAPLTPASAMLRTLSGDGGADVVVACDGDVIVGHAMAVDADGNGDGGGRMAEIGVVVADPWQGQGVGSALMRALLTRAQARGVTSVTMDVLHGNSQVFTMIAAHWPVVSTRHCADCVTVWATLPADLLERPDPRPSARVPVTSPRGSHRLAGPVAPPAAGRSPVLSGSRSS